MTTTNRPKITPHQQTQIRLMAMKAHYLYLASLPRPLTAEAPAEDEDADEEWRQGSEELIKAADKFKWLPSRDALAEHERKLFDLFFDHYNRGGV